MTRVEVSSTSGKTQAYPAPPFRSSLCAESRPFLMVFSRASRVMSPSDLSNTADTIPCVSTYTSDAHLATSTRSCEITSVAPPRLACALTSTPMLSRTTMSTPDWYSSKISTSHSWAATAAIARSCCCPPDKWDTSDFSLPTTNDSADGYVALKGSPKSRGNTRSRNRVGLRRARKLSRTETPPARFSSAFCLTRAVLGCLSRPLPPLTSCHLTSPGSCLARTAANVDLPEPFAPTT